MSRCVSCFCSVSKRIKAVSHVDPFLLLQSAKLAQYHEYGATWRSGTPHVSVDRSPMQYRASQLAIDTAAVESNKEMCSPTFESSRHV